MYAVTVLGATGTVGRKIIEILEERDFPINTLTLLASQKSAGKRITFKDQELATHDATQFDFTGQNIVFMAAGSKTARQYAHKAVEAGAVVFDVSSAFRMEKDIPLIIPTVNPQALQHMPRHIASGPNCVASPVATVLKPLHEAYGVERTVISTYQSVSGAGKKGMDELYDQTKNTYMNAPLTPATFDKPIAFNVIPRIDMALPNGITAEESKIALEIKKTLDPNIKVAVHCVRVPVFIGHCTSLTLELERDFNIEEAKKLLRESPHIILLEGEDNDEIITPREIAGEDAVYVCRVRRDASVENGLMLWTCSDNLRRGAALDIVEIAELYIKGN